MEFVRCRYKQTKHEQVMIVMEDDFKTSIDIDVEQANEENRRREITLHDEVPGRMPLANQMFHERANWSAIGDIASGIVSSSDIDRVSHPSNTNETSEVKLEAVSASGCKNGYTRGQICMDDCSQCCGICMRDLRVKVAAFCGGIGDALCQCANGICKGLSLLATGTCTGVSLLGQCLYGICSVQWLLHLFLPLCSMSIAISSVVLPYWAWGETDDVAVGLFKCCNFTEKNRNSTISECSPLSDCFPSESNVNSLIKAAAGIQIIYIAFHGITILSTTISQLIRNSNERERCQFYNGMVVFLAATICFISIIVSFSGVIQSHSLKGVPPRLSINLAIFSCAVYISYAAVCVRKPTLYMCTHFDCCKLCGDLYDDKQICFKSCIYCSEFHILAAE
ncbi:uncharacterized protein LOC128223329 [Mya arenaria]|uniref:uncharacterized protein LOC128223329 n=1 Tax=Mya arenaria TaxID=6604 RepID=UPI0022E6A2BF|nr:uncharacterized protein LOC128223329 [Mya arenaria]